MMTPEQKKEQEEILKAVNPMLPMYNPIENDIKELEDDLELIHVLMVLCKNKERAIKLTVSLPHGQSLEYWIDNNSNVREMLINERILIQKQLAELKK